VTTAEEVHTRAQLRRIAAQIGGLGDRVSAIERTEQLAHSSVPDKDGTNMGVTEAMRAGLDGLDKAATALEEAASAKAAADGKVTVYYQTTVPSDPQLGDFWVDTSNNHVSTWDGDTWQPVTSDTVATALADAQNAQTTADGKIVSYWQDTAPSASEHDLGTGDLWYDTSAKNKPHWWDGNKWQDIHDGHIDDAQDTADGAKSDAANAQDTADSARSTANSAHSIAQAAQSTANGKNTVFYQGYAPTANRSGDLWFDTSNGFKPYRWTGSQWSGISYGQAAIASGAVDWGELAFSTIDAGRISVYSLDAITATLGSVTAGDITGSTLETDGGGVRIGLSPNGSTDSHTISFGRDKRISGYESTNQLYFQSNGRITFQSYANSAAGFETESLGTNVPWAGNTTSRGAGFKYATGAQGVYAVESNGTTYVRVHALAFSQSSAAAAKRDVQDLPTPALDVIAANPARKWRYHPDKAADPEAWHVGPMADDLPDEVTSTDDAGDTSVDLGSMIGLVWSAVSDLAERVAALETPAETGPAKPARKPRTEEA
jgi:hypothetical protein